jgi:hypothetical protein
MTPNIPESGTKSRVETQVRVTVDLAHASSSSGEQHQYDRVGSWKWLKLPPGTSTKKRTRREGKIGEWRVMELSTLALTLSKTLPLWMFYIYQQPLPVLRRHTTVLSVAEVAGTER